MLENTSTSPKPDSYSTSQFPTWCPGCGDFGIWGSLKQALSTLGLSPHQFLTIFGIGCSGNMASFLNCYSFHSLHGRAIPTAIGAKLANHQLPVLVIGGDGDLLGEGLSHLIHAARANHDITVILHNNQVYGLTTGQASPTAPTGFIAKATPSGGTVEEPLNPCLLAISQQAGFVARGFAGDMPQLVNLMIAAIKYPGFSLLDVLQPCVTFNKVNTYDWFRQRIKQVDSPTDNLIEGMDRSRWSEVIYTGVLYQNSRSSFHQRLPQLQRGSLKELTGQRRDISSLLQSYR